MTNQLNIQWNALLKKPFSKQIHAGWYYERSLRQELADVTKNAESLDDPQFVSRCKAVRAVRECMAPEATHHELFKAQKAVLAIAAPEDRVCTVLHDRVVEQTEKYVITLNVVQRHLFKLLKAEKDDLILAVCKDVEVDGFLRTMLEQWAFERFIRKPVQKEDQEVATLTDKLVELWTSTKNFVGLGDPVISEIEIDILTDLFASYLSDPKVADLWDTLYNRGLMEMALFDFRLAVWHATLHDVIGDSIRVLRGKNDFELWNTVVGIYIQFRATPNIELYEEAKGHIADKAHSKNYEVAAFLVAEMEKALVR
jgi:hypothetical protein